MKNSLQANSITSSQSPIQRFGLAASLCVILVTALDFASPARAVSVDSLFHSPVLTDAVAPQKVLVLPDDSFFVYWNFDRLNTENVGPLVKFNANGTHDPSFRMAGNYFHVLAVAPGPNGQFYVAARHIDKITSQYRVLRLNSDGSLDASFDAGTGADSTINSLAVQPDGTILVGGIFTTFNGQDRPNLVRLNPDGSLDLSFARVSVDLFSNNPNSPGIWSNIIIQPDGKILFAGVFDTVSTSPGSGAYNQGVARVNIDGTLDTTFNATDHGLPNVVLRALALQNDNKILVGGRFTGPQFGTRTPLIRLNADGSLEHRFPSAVGTGTAGQVINAIKLLANGDILGVGDRLYRFTTAGTIVPGYQDKVGFRGLGLDLQSDGRFLVAGFSTLNGVPQNGLMRFNADGSSGTPVGGDFQRELFPRKLAVRTDGKIWLTDYFLDGVDGNPRGGVARLQADGELDAFDPPSLSPKVDFALHPDDTVLILETGAYFQFNGDDSPAGGVNGGQGALTQVLPATDGRYIALNNFSPEAVANNGVIFRLLPDGSRDPDFLFGIPFSVTATNPSGDYYWLGDNRPLAFYEDGRFLARYFDSTGKYHLKRFNNDGSIDPTFVGGEVAAITKTEGYQTVTIGESFSTAYVTTAPGTPLSDVLLLPDGKIVVVGMFDQYTGTPAPGIVRLEPNGAVDATFNTGAGAQWISTQVDATHIPRIDAIERLADGRFLITGSFEAYDGTAASGIARLNADGSRDDTFVSPVTLSSIFSDLFADYPSFVADFPVSQLVTQPDGSVLLSGNYSQVGSNEIRSIFRLTGLTSTAALNISTRMRVETGENVLIGGFIITGNAPKKVIVRAIGPSLGALGVPGALANPTLELRSAGGGLLANNDDWRGAQQTEIQQSGLQPQNDLESAIIATLQPGQYTAIVADKDGTTGAGLLEVYDLDRASDSELANISTRGFVQTGDNVMIGGFILGNSAGATRVLVRGIGPSLSGVGISGALQDPMLELFDGHGTQLASNDDWKDSQQALIEDTGIPPTRNEEPAILANLLAGNYTAIVRGKNNSTGVAVVEVYNIR